jgi:hypothetical protein
MADQAMNNDTSQGFEEVSRSCALAAGEALGPWIVMIAVLSAICRHLIQRDVCFGTDFIVKTREKPYLVAETFSDYLRRVFCTYLNEPRTNEAFGDQGSAGPKHDLRTVF